MYESRVVAFLDILGFRDLCKEKEAETFILKILASIRAQNSDFSITLEPIDEGSSRVNSTPDFASFSDHIIISAPLHRKGLFSSSSPTHSHLILIGTIITNAIRQINMLALNNGVALRGAISIGDVFFDKTNNIIFGQPLIEAVRDEEALAIFPRVIVSNNLLQFYENAIKDISTFGNPLPGFNLRRDFDGIYHVDWLDFLLGSNQNKDNIFNFLTNMQKVIKDNIQNHKKVLKIISKWCWLAGYFDLKIQRWNNNNPEKAITLFNLQQYNIESTLDAAIKHMNKENA